jgi:hypothetical protein
MDLLLADQLLRGAVLVWISSCVAQLLVVAEFSIQTLPSFWVAQRFQRCDNSYS